MDSPRQYCNSSSGFKIILSVSFHFLWMIFLRQALGVSVCPPAEEGKPYDIQCTIPNSSSTNSDVVWETSGDGAKETVSCSCRMFTLKCICTEPGPPRVVTPDANASLTLDGDNYTASLHVSTVTRTHLWGSWECRQSGQTFQLCQWAVFARANKLTCAVQETESVNTGKVIVQCRTEDIYPLSAHCHFYRKTNGTSAENMTLGPDVTVDSQGKQCTLRVTPGLLGTGQHSFGVYMYPNVTGQDTDKVYGLSSPDTNPIKLGPTANINDCPGSTDSVNVKENYVLEGTNISCRCSWTNDTFFPASVRWINTFGGVSSGGPESKVLTFTAQSNQELRCEVTNSVHVSSQVTQSLQVGSPPAIVAFILSGETDTSVMEANTTVTFTCEAEGNPRPSLSLQKRVGDTDLPESESGSKILKYTKLMACEDTGVYLCRATSQLGGAFGRMTLNVPCPQQLINSNDKRQVYPAHTGDNLTISVPIFGYPEPIRLHLTGDKTQLETNDFEINYVSQEPPNGTVDINFVVLEEKDFQSYILNVTNTQGSLIYHFQIQSQEADSDVFAALIATGGVLVVVAVTAVVGVAVCARRRKRNQTHSPACQDYITVIDPSDQASAHTGKVDGGDYAIPAAESNQRADYYNFVTAETTTAIPVTSLSTFMSSYGTEYFRKQFEKVPVMNKVLPTSIGMSGTNRQKNTYTDFCTYDNSGVHFKISEDSQHNYINASYIEGYDGKEMFIACEGPTKVTRDDFIRMLWKQKPDRVVMLSNLTEEGKVVCERYWPEDGQPLRFGDVTVSLDACHDFADYSVRQLILQRERDPAHRLTQFHFTTWPDKAVPPSPWTMADFNQRVATVPTTKPIVVHDSDSVGRTGTYIALCNALREAECTGSVDFYTLLVKLRNARPHMFQSHEQYIFLHQAVLVSHICLCAVVNETNLTERIGKLQTMSSTGETHLEMEYSVICNTCTGLSNTLMQSPENDIGDMSQYSNGYANMNCVIRRQLRNKEEDSEGSSRIVLIPSFTKGDHQLLSQLPMPGTVEDFWHQVLQYQVSTIVSSTMDNISLPRETPTYLPPTEDDSLTCGPFHVRSGPPTFAKLWKEQGLVISTDNQQVISSNNAHVKTTQHRVSHMKCMCTGTDADSSNLLKIVEQIRLRRSANDGRTWYMSRDGASCSGLLCTLVQLLDRLDNDHYVSVPLVVGSLKFQYSQIIPTKHQYRVLYEVLKLYQGTRMTSWNHQPSDDDTCHVYDEIEEQ